MPDSDGMTLHHTTPHQTAPHLHHTAPHHTAPHLLTSVTPGLAPPADGTSTALRLGLGGLLGRWLTIGMPMTAFLLAGAMTVAMWSERRYAQVAVFAGASLLFALMAVCGSSFGYVEDRRSLGQRNGLIGGWSWIDLDDVVAISDGRQPLVSTRYLVLWSRTSQSDLWGARLARFTVRLPQHVRYGGGLGAELHPFRIDWALLGRRNSRRLLLRLRQRGLTIDPCLLPGFLRRPDR
jgi:hypothetical protein